MKTYIFDPLKHGFEPITNYPELGYNFPMIDGYYVKIVCYTKPDEINWGGLVYWYKIISNHVGLKPDDRVQILNGVYDFRRSNENQNKPSTEYLGLISNDIFAESLLKHLLGTTRNDSLNTDSIIRYNENLGLKMRNEYSKYYKNIK